MWLVTDSVVISNGVIYTNICRAEMHVVILFILDDGDRRRGELVDRVYKALHLHIMPSIEEYVRGNKRPLGAQVDRALCKLIKLGGVTRLENGAYRLTPLGFGCLDHN